MALPGMPSRSYAQEGEGLRRFSTTDERLSFQVPEVWTVNEFAFPQHLELDLQDRALRVGAPSLQARIRYYPARNLADFGLRDAEPAALLAATFPAYLWRIGAEPSTTTISPPQTRSANNTRYAYRTVALSGDTGQEHIVGTARLNNADVIYFFLQVDNDEASALDPFFRSFEQALSTMAVNEAVILPNFIRETYMPEEGGDLMIVVASTWEVGTLGGMYQVELRLFDLIYTLNLMPVHNGSAPPYIDPRADAITNLNNAFVAQRPRTTASPSAIESLTLPRGNAQEGTLVLSRRDFGDTRLEVTELHGILTLGDGTQIYYTVPAMPVPDGTSFRQFHQVGRDILESLRSTRSGG